MGPLQAHLYDPVCGTASLKTCGSAARPRSQAIGCRSFKIEKGARDILDKDCYVEGVSRASIFNGRMQCQKWHRSAQKFRHVAAESKPTGRHCSFKTNFFAWHRLYVHGVSAGAPASATLIAQFKHKPMAKQRINNLYGGM